jgi:N-methylhydantoinase A
VVSVEKGHDPRELTLMPFGGAGPLHASGVARLLGIRKILVPLMPGILCAQGLVVSDLKEDFVRTVRASLDPSSLRSVLDVVGELHKEAEDWFDAEQIPVTSRATEFEADMRYVGQNYELPVQFAPVDGLAALAARLTHDFHREHDRQYGFHSETAEISIVNVRLTAIGRLAKPEPSPVIGGLHADAPLREERPVHFDRRPVIAGVYDRSDLAPGHRIAGPAIIEQLDATTVLLPGDVAEIDQFLNINVEVPYGF